MKIAILDDYQDAVRKLSCFELLKGLDVKIFQHGAKGQGQLAIRLADFDVLVLIRERTTLNRALISRLPKLKLICQTGRIGTHVDLKAAREREIAVVDGAGDPIAAAELTWALILAANRKVLTYANLMQQGIWQSSSINPERNTIGRGLHGRTLGIWGYGRIGQQVARYANAFGMQVLVWGSEASRSLASEHGLTTAQSKEELFMQSDVLCLHLRLSETTRHIVSAHELGLMKTDALVVNTSRAELIAPNALEQALKAGRPGAAAVDVYESEPVLPTLALLRLENVLATPHIGFVEQNSYERYFRPAFEAIQHFVHGRPVNNIATKA
ncbi:MAG: D-2-hydroxyacid dehydrogenase family protein [Sulfuritalea sp.]|nr:D-2-hydroxyacid dehydrogenase family protein [Polynucleobacter sp.]MCF8187144.1 D-2-hydroxyacid dehydrogenase family protein [Sulfuritalea sp.]